jgi:hypothetical protein
VDRYSNALEEGSNFPPEHWARLIDGLEIALFDAMVLNPCVPEDLHDHFNQVPRLVTCAGGSVDVYPE